MPSRRRIALALALAAGAAALLATPAAASSGPMTRWLAGQIGPVQSGAPLAPATASHPLRLVRSYWIPAGDPSAARLANRSWTYDSAVTAVAFAASGDRADARTVLDQLSALQRSDGSIATYFDVRTGASSGIVRSGVVAWAGLAAAAYDHRFGSSRFASAATRAAAWLMARRGADGLVRGGPGVAWVSTQHNLLAYALLQRLGQASAARRIAHAIDAGLLVSAGGPHFREGLGDPVLALDVQSLGAMYLRSRGEDGLARRVLGYANAAFAVGGRSIVRSAAPATYNETYSAAGPFAGYRPYAGAGTPDVLWFEGTAQMRAAEADAGLPTAALDASLRSWERITAAGDGAPLMADRTVTVGSLGDYHVWPGAAAAAWAVLAERGAGLFPAAG